MKNLITDFAEAGNTFSSTKETLDLIFNHLDDTYLLVGKDLRIIYTNELTRKKIHEYFGVEITSESSVLDMVSNSRRNDLIKIYEEVFNGAEKKTETEININGTSVYFENIFKPVRNSCGEIAGALIISKNITENKKAEIQLTQMEERWRFALEGGNQGVWDWNLQTGDIFYSDSYKRLYGYAKDEMKGRIEEWEAMVHPDDLNAIGKAIEKHVSSSDPFYESTYRIKAKSGEYKWILARGMLISRDADGKPVRMIGTHTDITKQITAEETYKILFYSNPLPMWTYDLKTLRFTAVNDAAIHHYGYSKKEFLSMTIKDIRPPEDVATLEEVLTNRKNINLIRGCWRHLKKNKEIIFVEVSTHKLDQGSNHEVLVVAHDITSQITAEEKLVKSNERFDIMMKATHDLIWDWNLENNTIYRDPSGLLKVYGVACNQSIENIEQWLTRIHPEEAKRVQAVIGEIIQSTKQDTFEIEYRFQKDDGHYTYVYDRGKIIRNEEGKPIRMIGAAQNINDRKLLEQELLKTELDKQKAINQATVDSQEQERTEIGKELHDNVNQVLTTTKLYLDLALSNHELKDELIAKSTKNILTVINEIRQLSRSLMDPTIGDLGLIDSLNDLVENINFTRKLQVSMKAERRLEFFLQKNHQLTIFRIVQEALNNCIKYANATNVLISCKLKGENAEVIIEDNGIGFNPALVKKGAGLKNIQNRVYLVNGTCKIESANNKGCKIVISFPLFK